MSLTDAQIAQIAENIYILRDPAKAKLPKPVTTTGAGSLAAKLDPIGKKFNDMGLGVIDFTGTNPAIWLHNESDSWRIASTSKLAMMLAAVQLRAEVRAIKTLGIISTPQDFDALYALDKLWKASKVSKADQIPKNPPRISTIFDFSKDPINFTGPDPDKPDKDGLAKREPSLMLTPETVSNYSFSERYWFACAVSENMAATSCISEIGVPYIKAVMRAYGFFDDDAAKGMRLLLSEGFSLHDFRRQPVSVNSGPRTSPKFDPLTDFRPLTDREPHEVKDWNTSFGFRSAQSGSAAALTGFMLALMTNALGDPGMSGFGGTLINSAARFQACETIRNNMADGSWYDAPTTLGEAIGTITHVDREIDKVGLLKKSDGEVSALECEFIYLETTENGGGKAMKYAIIATGVTKGRNGDLGQAIHKALL